MRDERELETLAAAVHGALATLHLLGFLYNVRRGNAFDTVVHGITAIYDINAVRIHRKALR